MKILVNPETYFVLLLFNSVSYPFPPDLHFLYNQFAEIDQVSPLWLREGFKKTIESVITIIAGGHPESVET